MRSLVFVLVPAVITEAILAYGVSIEEAGCVPSSILSFAGIMTHLPSALLLGDMRVLKWWWITLPLQTAIWAAFFAAFYVLFIDYKRRQVA
jgi:hypothetical protein